MNSKGQKRSSRKGQVKKVSKNAASSQKKSESKLSARRTNAPIVKIGLWQLTVKTGVLKWSTHVKGFVQWPNGAPKSLDALEKKVHAEDQLFFRTNISNAITIKGDFFAEVRVQSKNGESQWVELNASPVFNTMGALVAYSGTIRDVNRKKRTEIELSNWKTKTELIAESAGILIYDYDVASGSIDWNGNVVKIVGFEPEEMNTIDKWEALIHPDDREEANQLLTQAQHDMKPYDVYYRFKTKRGEYCYMHDRGLFVANTNGEATRMLGIMNDVSAQVEALNKVARSEKSYKDLFNSVSEAIYIQDIDGTFLDVNNEVCRLYGYRKDELLGKNALFLAAPGMNDFEKLKEQHASVVGGAQQSFNWWGQKKSGEIFLKEVRLTKGSYFGKDAIIATARDITDRLKAQSSLQESETRFRRMIEDLNIAVIMLGPEGELLNINRAAKELFPEIQEQFQMQGFIAENGEGISSNVLPWETAMNLRTPVRGEVLGMRGPDGNERWLLVNSDPAIHNDTLLHVIITFTDITERKHMEEHWKESELRFRTLQEASFGGIGLHRKGLIVDCNQGLCDLTGYNYDELIGMNGLNLIAPEHRDFVLDKIVNQFTSPYDVVGIRKDGTRYSLEIHGKNIPYKDGLLRVTEFRDITERKLSEEKILEQNARLLVITEDLKQKNEQLREFTQIVSHNLRSPVGNILSLLSLIENAKDPEDRDDAIGLLKEAGTTTLTTLTELNQVLQIQQNKNIKRQELNFEEVFNNVLKLLNAKIAEAGAKVKTDFSRAPTVFFPKIYLESILLNLLSNALKYAHPKRVPEIQVKTLLNDDQSVSMMVADNGSGLNMEKYGHQVFKLRKTFHKHPESRGIGLFMIKNQIETMGGKISLSSIENEGSVFQIDFNKTPNDE